MSPEKQIYHCFGCGKGGNVYSFLMEYEGVGFVEAVKELASPLNVDIERYLTGSEDRSRFDPFYHAMEFAQITFPQGAGGEQRKQPDTSREGDSERNWSRLTGSVSRAPRGNRSTRQPQRPGSRRIPSSRWVL